MFLIIQSQSLFYCYLLTNGRKTVILCNIGFFWASSQLLKLAVSTVSEYKQCISSGTPAQQKNFPPSLLRVFLLDSIKLNFLLISIFTFQILTKFLTAFFSVTNFPDLFPLHLSPCFSLKFFFKRRSEW